VRTGWGQPRGGSWGRNQMRARSAVVATTRKFLVGRAIKVQVCCGGNHEEVLGGGTKPGSGLLWWQPRRSSWWEEQTKSRCSVEATMGKFLVEEPNQVQVCCGGNHEEVLGESRRGLDVLWWQPRGSSWWRNQTRFRSGVVATMRKFLVEKPNYVQVCCGGNHEEVVGGEAEPGSGLLWWQP